MASNPIAANLLMLVVFCAGLASLGSIRKEVFPSFPTDTFTVTVPYPGSSPEEVEQGVIIKIEEALRDIVGIKEIRSVAQEGVGVVTVEMQAGTDLSKALNEAKVRVDGIAAFPLDAEAPIVEELIWRSGAIRVSVSGDVDERSLKRLGEQIRDEILALDGISEINVLGEREYEISVEVSDAALRRYGLDFDQVVTAVRARSRDLPGGRVRTAQGSVTLRSVSQAYTGEEFAALVLLSRDDGTRLLLGDVASVSDGFVDQPVLSTLNGRRALTLVVDRVGDQNVLHITAQVREYIERKRAGLAPGIHLDGWYDQSEILRGRISLMLRNAAQGAFLVVLTLGLFLDIGLALWVIMGVPFAVLATLATIQIFGLPISINVLSVFAFILVLGILVDDGIVTAESAYARLEAERQGLASIVRGVRRVSTATVFGALTTMIAFGPSLFLTEGFARAMTHIGPVVILCLLFSLIETKLILPAHLRNIRIDDDVARHGVLARIRRTQRRFTAALSEFARGPYTRTLDLAVRNRYITLALFVSVLIICLALVPSGIVRFVFFPNVPSNGIAIKLEMPQGTAWQKTHAYAQRVEVAAQAMNQRFKEQDAAARDVIAELLVVSDTDTSARIDIELLSSEERSITSVVLAQWLREALGPLEGVRSLSIDANAGPGIPAFDIELRGHDIESLRRASEELRHAAAGISGVHDIRDTFNGGGAELDIRVTREGAALGLGDVELARQVRQAFFGAEIQRVQRARHEVRVYTRFPESARTTLATLRSMWVRLPDGRKVPFPVVGEAHEQSGVSAINRIDRQRVVDVQADINKFQVEPGDVAQALTTEALPGILARYPGVSYKLSGEAEAEQQSSQALWFGLIGVLLLIFGALAIPLRSYVQPLLIMSVIPFGIIGAIIGHLLLGKDISMLSVIGIIGLVGVVVNDSLVLVDFINHYIDEGRSWREAVMEAGPTRFRAVILTSLTTFVGLLPIQLETSIQSEFVKPMAISVAFGVLFATFVTLFLVPTLYFIGKDLGGLFGKAEALPGVEEAVLPN